MATWVNLMDIIYPVGSVYSSYTSTSPASRFGGTWTPITGVFPYFNAGTGTGGSSSHTHGLSDGAAMIDLWHYNGDRVVFHKNDASKTFSGKATASLYLIGNESGVASESPSGHATQLRGSTNSASNMPPYQTLYAWRRTA